MKQQAPDYKIVLSSVAKVGSGLVKKGEFLGKPYEWRREELVKG